MESKIETLRDFLPRDADVMVGKEKLTCKEYTIAKRDAAVHVLLSNVDVAQLLKPLMDAVRARGGAGTDVGELFGRFRDLALKLLSHDLSLVSCVTLDVAENRAKVGVDDKVETDKEHGFEYSPAMFRWVRDNLTQPQEFHLIKTIVDVNDIVGLVKNYWTLIAPQVKAVGAMATASG
jgi:hypothetical protein